jgi:hypothetical protein
VLEAWRRFVFDLGACRCQNIKCSGRGSRYGGGETARDSSEAEPHPRGRPALERGGDSPVGASSPRARQNLTRGGRPPLERGGVSLVRCCAPRAKRSFARGWPGLAALVGRWGRQVRGPLPLGHECVFVFCEFVCIICERNGVSPGCLGDPYGCPRQQDHHRDPTSTLILAPGTPTWSSMQGSHVV